jgi:hypothetical protein
LGTLEAAAHQQGAGAKLGFLARRIRHLSSPVRAGAKGRMRTIKKPWPGNGSGLHSTDLLAGCLTWSASQPAQISTITMS